MNKEQLTIFLGRPAHAVARDLIGCTLLLGSGDSAAGGIIVETEAYTSDDPASHTFRGKSVRNAAMYGPPGTIYIYFTYGMHYCMNIVTGNSDGQAVLLRALQPTQGIAYMAKRRGGMSTENLCNGPAKLVQALGVTKDLNGKHLLGCGFHLTRTAQNVKVAIGPRIGIIKNAHALLNFQLSHSLFISPYAKRKKFHS